jgi:hypothetical protein
VDEKNITTEEAARIGCMVSLGSFAIIFLLSVWIFWIYPVIYIFTGIPIIMMGALTGKYFTKTQEGAWVGTWIGMVLGLWLSLYILLYHFVSNA